MTFKRMASFLLTLVLCAQMAPVTAFATEDTGVTDTTDECSITLDLSGVSSDVIASETPEDNPIDLFVFAGQSNMMGAAVLEPEVNEFTDMALEYKYMPKLRGEKTGSFVSSQNPAGEFHYIDLTAAYGDKLYDLTYKSTLTNYTANTYFCPAMRSGTKSFAAQSESDIYASASLAPYFATEYASYGHTSVYTHMAKGAVKIDHYFTEEMAEHYNSLIAEYNTQNSTSFSALPTDNLSGAGEAFDDKYKAMLEDYAAFVPGNSVENKCFVWLQGEGDASGGYAPYKLKMQVLWEHLQELGFTHFFVLRVGYWGSTSILNVIKAQEDFCAENENCYIVTRAPSLIPHPTATTDNWWISEPSTEYDDCRDSYLVDSSNHHFNEKAVQIFAERSAENVHRILHLGLEPILEEENIQGMVVKEEEDSNADQLEDDTPYTSYVGVDNFSVGLSISYPSDTWVEKASSTAASTNLIPVTSTDSVWIQYVFFKSEAHAVGGFYDEGGNLVAPLYYKDFGFSLDSNTGGVRAFKTPEFTNRVAIADVEAATGKKIAFVRFTAWQASAGGHTSTEARVYHEMHTHIYTSTITTPTCTEQGYTTYTCECGDNYMADYIDATGHTYEDGICTGCGARTGSCGTRLIWVLENGILTVSGTGAITGYSTDSPAPWSDCTDEITSVVIEPGVTQIGPYAFYECGEMIALSLPEGLQSIGFYAFGKCSKLTALEIPNSVTSIASKAFRSCVSISELVIPENVISFGNAFYKCSGLTKVQILGNIEELPNSAFSGCTNLSEIYFTGDAPQFNALTFEGCSATVYYPFGNETWTDDILQKYGGSIAWTPYCLNGCQFGNGTVVAPTCKDEGYTAYVCTVCGSGCRENYVDALGHIFENDICLNCGGQEINIIFIGNSFSQDSTYYLYEILKSALEDRVVLKVAFLNNSSRTMGWHATQAKDNLAGYRYGSICDETDEWSVILDPLCTSREILSSENWTAVILQPSTAEAYTGYSGQHYGELDEFLWMEDSIPYMLDYLDEILPEAKIYYHLTWSTYKYADMLNGSSDIYGDIVGLTKTMSALVGTESGRGFDGVVPVGTAIQNARTTYLALQTTNDDPTETIVGLQRDSVHLNNTFGRYTAALAYALYLFPEEVADAMDTLQLPQSKLYGDLPYAYLQILCDSALAAIETPYQVTTIDGYEEDPSVAAGETLSALTLDVSCTSDENAISSAVLAVLPADFAVDSVVIPEEQDGNFTAAVTIRFGYTSLTVDVACKVVEHNYEATVTDPTCTKQGYTTYACSTCGDNYVADYMDALNHDFQTYISDNNATCTADGTKTAQCERCDVTDTITDPGSALGHLFTHYSYNAETGFSHAVCDRGCGQGDVVQIHSDATWLKATTGLQGEEYGIGSMLIVLYDANNRLITARFCERTFGYEVNGTTIYRFSAPEYSAEEMTQAKTILRFNIDENYVPVRQAKEIT